MNKDTKIMLMAFAILLVGLVSFSFEDFTGNIQHEAENIIEESQVFTNNNCDVWICHDNYGCDKFKDTDCWRNKNANTKNA